MKFLLLVFLIILAAGLESRPAQAQDRIAYCKKIKARSHIPILESGIKFKSHYPALKEKLDRLNTDQFCECAIHGFENVFGADKLKEMDQYDYADKIPSEQLIAEDYQRSVIIFSCFGDQIGDKNMTPPSEKEVRDTISKSVRP